MEPRLLSHALLCAALLTPLAAAAQGSGRTIYCCEDDNGRPVCGDVLPGIPPPPLAAWSLAWA